MLYTFRGSEEYTFEIVNVKRRLTPLKSLLTIRAAVFDHHHREIAKVSVMEIPMLSKFGEVDTRIYENQLIYTDQYTIDLEEFLAFCYIYLAMEEENYLLRCVS